MSVLKNIKTNFLLRILSYNGVANVIRMLFGFATQKAIALLLGASGIAILANFRNFIELIRSLSSVGTYNGVVAQVAESKQTNSFQDVFNTVLTLFFSASILLCAILYWFQDWMAIYVFLGDQFGNVLTSVILMVPFIGINILIEAILTGRQAYKSVVQIQTLTAFVSALLIIVLLYYKGIFGALIAIVIRPLIGLTFAFLYLKKHKSILKLFVFFRPSTSKLKTLLPFVVMTLISGVFIQITELLLRNLISQKININAAGHWTALNAISSYYFSFIVSAFTFYVLPKYAQTGVGFHLKNEVKYIIQTLVPVVTVLMTTVFIFRTPIIQLLYTHEFLEIKSLFKWQLLADWFRVIFLVFAYYLIAKKRLRDHIVIEVFSFSLVIVASLTLITPYGLDGIVLANAIRYAACLFLVVFLLRKPLLNVARTKLD